LTEHCIERNLGAADVLVEQRGEPCRFDQFACPLSRLRRRRVININSVIALRFGSIVEVPRVLPLVT